MNAATKADGYKFFHKQALHSSIERIYENFTSRNGRLSNVPEGKDVAFVGMQAFLIKYLVQEWGNTFFNLSKEQVVRKLKRRLDNYFGFDFDVAHFEELHDLGYLPIEIKALEEGQLVPYGIPMFTMVNTVDGYGWLVGFLETIVSTYNWPLQTSTTTAVAYLKQTMKVIRETGMDEAMLPFMCHDFSFRGDFGPEAAAMSGFGHLAAGFAGTDTLPAIDFAELYYSADVETELVGCSVPATEHATSTSYMAIVQKEQGLSQFDAEVEYMRYLMEIVPTGIVSHVSDSYDFWSIVTNALPILKDEIMARDGCFVIRPDSGDPVEVLTGLNSVLGGDYPLTHGTRMGMKEHGQDTIRHTDGKYYGLNTAEAGGKIFVEITPTAEQKGLVECLHEIFGGTMTSEGYKLLDSHIGAIYGDAITLDRQKQIHERLMAKGFAPSVVLGIGSYSYQYVTRDTHGSAIKATCAYLDTGEQVDFGKDPKTDLGKKSAKGLLRVDYNEDGVLTLYQDQTPEQEQQGLLRTVFKDGRLYNKTTLRDVRAKIASQL